MQNKVRPIAIYLPQFHPVPENDKWWGRGFTEWTNVVNAKPRFRNHYQPHLPADLGFYDLRLEESRMSQAELAKAYGVYGFCYYHYWFNGKKMLERPFQEVFESGSPDLPFMLCWANENWTRVWDGSENEVLLKQEYSHEDDIKHINSLIPYFKDNRYIKVKNKPVFSIYKDSLFPNIEQTIRTFRNEVLKHNMELYLCKFERYTDSSSGKSIHQLGFDAAIEFQPLSVSWREYTDSIKKTGILKYLAPDRYVRFLKRELLRVNSTPDRIVNMRDFVEFDLARSLPEYKIYPGVSPSWDNSSRRQGRRALIFHNSTPSLFKHWVSGKLEKFQPFSEEENFIFINAWNEWAEGNHLEPCQRYGRGYLEALKECLMTQHGGSG